MLGLCGQLLSTFSLCQVVQHLCSQLLVRRQHGLQLQGSSTVSETWWRCPRLNLLKEMLQHRWPHCIIQTVDGLTLLQV